MSSSSQQEELRQIYRQRFTADQEYRSRVWKVLVEEIFCRFIRPTDTVLDLGCGYGDFINNVRCARKLAMDLNPDSLSRVDTEVEFLHQNCADKWELPDQSLDAVFTSNFFEHLPDKPALGRTLDQACRCLKPAGLLIAMGPNIHHLNGAYWDFWDHHIALSHFSLQEAMQLHGFSMREVIDRMLPYTLAHGRHYPLFCLRVYLRFRLAWRVWGKQFLVIGERRES